MTIGQPQRDAWAGEVKRYHEALEGAGVPAQLIPGLLAAYQDTLIRLYDQYTPHRDAAQEGDDLPRPDFGVPPSPFLEEDEQ